MQHSINVRVDVRTLVTKDSVRGLLKMCPEGDLVRHGARGQEERRVFAGQLGHVCLEGNGRGFMIDIVAKGRERSIGVHLLGWDCISLSDSAWPPQ